MLSFQVREIRSPCTRLCDYNRNLKLCSTCGRTKDQITRWLKMTEEERNIIMKGLSKT